MASARQIACRADPSALDKDAQPQHDRHYRRRHRERTARSPRRAERKRALDRPASQRLTPAILKATTSGHRPCLIHSRPGSFTGDHRDHVGAVHERWEPLASSNLASSANLLSSPSSPVRLYHYRDRDQYEVDAELEAASGEIVACAVKAAQIVRPEDFRGIERLARRLGDRLVAGIVLYAGQSPYPSATSSAPGQYPRSGRCPPGP